MKLKFCFFNDLINIQNGNFIQHHKWFEPKILIETIKSDAEELFDCEIDLQICKLPDILIGDYERLEYLLFFLIKISIKRNRYFQEME